MEDRNSLYKCVQSAVKQAMAEDKTTFNYFTVDRAVEILKDITTQAEWDKRFLFNIVVRHYIAIIAAELGYRSGIRGKSVYFEGDTAHEIVSKGLLVNAKDLMDAHEKVYSAMVERHNALFKKNTTDGQMGFDEAGNMFQEMTLNTLIDLIKQAEKTA